MSFLEKLLHRQTDIGQSRTSTLNPIQWFLAILLIGLAALLATKAIPVWLLIILAVGICLAFALFSYAFLWLLHNDRDALRSESFVLSRMRIEKGLMGDSEIGLSEVDQLPNGDLLKLASSVIRDEGGDGGSE